MVENLGFLVNERKPNECKRLFVFCLFCHNYSHRVRAKYERTLLGSRVVEPDGVCIHSFPISNLVPSHTSCIGLDTVFPRVASRGSIFRVRSFVLLLL